MRTIKHRVGIVGLILLILFWAPLSTVAMANPPHASSPLEYEANVLPPKSVWISPTSYNDPENYWDNETKAFDGNVDSKAGCTIINFFWTWTPWIELTLSSPITCNKTRFYAWYDDLHCNMIDIDLYYNNSWHHLFQGAYMDREWVVYSFQTLSGVMKTRMSFHVQRWVLWPVTADLHEFQFFGYFA